MLKNAYQFFSFAGIFIAFASCQKPKPDGAIPLHRVTFRVLPAVMPDSGKVYITGNNSSLGNGSHARVPLEKQNDGSWRQTFDFSNALKIECKFDLGSPLTEAVAGDSVPLGKLAFTVKQDTTIAVAVANWKDAVLNPREKLSPTYRADVLMEKARRVLISMPDDQIPCYKQAAVLYAQASAWEKQIKCLVELGNLWYRKGDFDQAQKFYENALQSAIKNFGENHVSVALAYERLGNFYTNLGEYDKSIEYGQLAINLWKQECGEICPEFPGLYKLLAEIYRRQGKYNGAMVFRQKALDFTIKKFGPTHQEVGNLYKSIGNIYAEQADYAQALNYFDKAWKIFSCYPH